MYPTSSLRHPRHLALVTAALSLLLSGRAAAQVRGTNDHLVRIGMAGGTVVPVGDETQALRRGVHGEAFVLVHLGPLPALRFNLGYQKLDVRDVLTGRTSGETTTLASTAGLHLDLIPGPVRPYLTAGVGAFRIAIDTLTASGSTAAARAASVHFGLDGGAGVSIRVRRIEAFVEGRIQNVYTDRGFIDKKNIRTIPVAFGVMF